MVITAMMVFLLAAVPDATKPVTTPMGTGTALGLALSGFSNSAAAQNMVAVNFIEKQLKVRLSWGEWFIAAAPFAAIMTVALYFIMTRMMKPEMEEIAGGSAT